MGTVTSGFCDSAKVEIMAGGHCFQASYTSSANTTTVINTTTLTLGGSDDASALVVGMSISGSGIAANTYIAAIANSTTIIMSKAATASATHAIISFQGDQFNLVLITGAPTGSYDSTFTNYASIGGDEVSGTGYTTGGFALTNVSALLDGTTACITFATNPSWTTATFNTLGCVLVNTSSRMGGVTGRAVAVYSFGSEQSILGGDFTLVLPSDVSGLAILQIT
jgi:hypothetical protein